MLFFGVSLFAESPQQSDADMWYLQARYYYMDRYDYAKAYDCLKQALQSDPEHKKALELKDKMGEIIEFIEKNSQPAPVEQTAEATVEAAAVTVETVVKPAIPGTEDFDFQLALKQIEELRLDPAVASLRKNLTIFPENISAWMYIFLIAERQQKELLLQEALQNAVKILPKYSKTSEYQDFLDLVNCYRVRHLVFKAVLEYNRDQALRRDVVTNFRYKFLDYDRERPEFPGMEKLDLTLLREKEYIEQLPVCSRNGQFSLENGGVRCSYHDNLLKQPYQQLVVAKKMDIKPVTLTETHRSLAHIESSRLFLKESRFYRALAEAEQAVSFDAGDYRSYDLMAQSYYGLGKFEKALEYAQKARGLAVDEPLVYNNLGLVFLALARVDDAIAVLRQGVALRDSDYDLHYNLGLAYLLKEEYSPAIKNFEIAKIIKPDSAGVYYNLGKVYLKTGDKESARAAYQKMLNLVPQDGKVYNMVVNILGTL
ncbi:MAG: tetratricopeptide repeat protein [Candidatus Wallbacteria bacterium]|nr:tetratricopeptide repeat protein [Candidatus Wallbacteria bacterium]